MMNIYIVMLRRSRIIDFIDCSRQALEREKIYLKISHQINNNSLLSNGRSSINFISNSLQ